MPTNLSQQLINVPWKHLFQILQLLVHTVVKWNETDGKIGSALQNDCLTLLSDVIFMGNIL